MIIIIIIIIVAAAVVVGMLFLVVMVIIISVQLGFCSLTCLVNNQMTSNRCSTTYRPS